MEFRERTISDFAIVFDAGSGENENAIASEGFASKWSWFGVMHRLCNQDISKLDAVTNISLLECLTWLSYETDLNEQNKVQINERKK